MDEQPNVNGHETRPVSKAGIPWVLALAGSIAAVAANFAQYLTASNFLFSRKVSVVQLIMEAVDSPETIMGTVFEKIIFWIIVAGVAFTLLALLFVLLRKMKGAVVFSILAILPFLLIGDAWIHYAGLSLTIIGAVWYRIAEKKHKKTAGPTKTTT